MHITTKGQVTIPSWIRNQMGFLPHTEVEFRVESGDVKLKKKTDIPSRGKAIVSKLKEKASTAISTEAIMPLTREV